MSEPHFSMTADDDLPRTIRREREAREREMREREAAVSVPSIDRDDFLSIVAPAAPAATVTNFDVPFAKLTVFFLKSVFAAIPALLMLTVLLWFFGQTLQSFFPQLLKLKILIYVPS